MESEAESHAELEAESRAEPEAESRAELEAESHAELEPESRAEPEPESHGEPEPESPGSASPLACVAHRPDDQLRSRWDGERAVIEIHSPRGIGGATIRSSSGSWPESVSLRLYLRGLESLEISNGVIVLTSSVLIRRGAPRIRGAMLSRPSGPLVEPAEVQPGEPGWLDVRVLDPEGLPVDRLPLEAGYFEIALPAMLLATRPAELEISWIDFYR